MYDTKQFYVYILEVSFIYTLTVTNVQFYVYILVVSEVFIYTLTVANVQF